MFKKNLFDITPYTPGTSIESIRSKLGKANIIKLASNENPLGPAVNFANVSSAIEYYPDYHAHPLVNALADRLNVLPNQLILGNGSDEILQLIGLALIEPGDEILSASCTFSEYKFVAQITGATYIQAPMVNYSYCVDNLIAAISERTKVIFIANPNNPTGTILTHNDILMLLNAVSPNTLVVLDEAYAEYVNDPKFPNSLSLISQYPNVLFTRTFSKIYGLAALRIGYAVAPPAIIEGLQRVRQPFNVNGLALSCAFSALKNEAFLNHSITVNNEGKQFLIDELTPIHCTIPPSEGNFLYLDINPINGIECCELLLQTGIIVRSMASFGQPNAIRVTIGTMDQNKRFIKEFRKCVNQLSA